MKIYNSIYDFLSENLLSGGEIDFDIPYNSFRESISRGLISANNIRALLEKEMRNPQFTWRGFALKSDFIPPAYILNTNDGAKITEEDISNYFKMLTWDVLYPEYYSTPLQKEELRRSIYYLLKEITRSEDRWVSVEELLSRLQRIKSEWSKLECYNIQLLFEPYRQGGLIEVKWKCLVLVSHLRINPNPEVDKFLAGLIRDGIEPFCLLPDFHWPLLKTS